MRDIYKVDPLSNKHAVIDRLKNWADQPAVSNRFFSIIVPEGTDKSGLTQEVGSRLQRDLKRLTFFVDLTQIAIPQGNVGMEDERNSPGKTTPGQWLQGAVSQARRLYGERIRYFDRTIVFPAMFDTLVYDLSESNPQLAPTLLVDGLESVSSQAKTWAEENLLSRFLGRSCTRLVMVLNDKYSIQMNKLRWEQHIEQL